MEILKCDQTPTTVFEWEKKKEEEEEKEGGGEERESKMTHSFQPKKLE